MLFFNPSKNSDASLPSNNVKKQNPKHTINKGIRHKMLSKIFIFATHFHATLFKKKTKTKKKLEKNHEFKLLM